MRARVDEQNRKRGAAYHARGIRDARHAPLPCDARRAPRFTAPSPRQQCAFAAFDVAPCCYAAHVCQRAARPRAERCRCPCRASALMLPARVSLAHSERRYADMPPRVRCPRYARRDTIAKIRLFIICC